MSELRDFWIWLGKFPTEDDFERYVNRDRGRSRFEKEFKVQSLHEYFAYKEGSRPLYDVLGGLWYSAGFIDAALEAAAQAGISDGDANTAIACQNPGKFSKQKLVEVTSPVRYIGKFTVDREATPVGALVPDKPPVEVEDHDCIVSVWLGTLKSEAALSRYMREQYKREDKPLSRFGGDFCIYYDSDFVEWRFADQPQGVSELLEGHSYAESFAPAAAEAAQKEGIDKANTIIIVYDFDYRQEAPFWGKLHNREEGQPNLKAPVQFLDAFAYEKP